MAPNYELFRTHLERAGHNIWCSPIVRAFRNVLNACRKGDPDGPLKVSTAKAFVVPHTGNSQLKAQFFWPFKGDYWIIALDDDYRYAMVGHPCKKYLWILNRTPSMDEKTYDMLVQTAKSKGYDVEKLESIPIGCPPPVNNLNGHSE